MWVNVGFTDIYMCTVSSAVLVDQDQSAIFVRSVTVLELSVDL
jgi:hypothetical protein